MKVAFGGDGVDWDRWGVTGGDLSSSWRVTCTLWDWVF